MTQPPHPVPLPGGEGKGEGVVPAALIARLEEAARRCYPPAARRFRLRGEATVRFCATPEGTAAQVALVRATGAPLLDSAAVGCVVPGAEPLPVTQGCYRVPVRFDAAR
ncbi:MAG: energy transducer TonB [Myxococcaceae bacterium]|nr:energy transducer TonB [Myxococcaceae bacterium]MCI0669277.1 energy transducer TonB [Myxococcaceae bacterium]